MDHIPDAERAEAMLGNQSYDVILPDIRLPAMSGKDLLVRLRRRGDSVPVLMLTAHASVCDKLDCFAAGADDFMVKPFDVRELVARIKALVRRDLRGLALYVRHSRVRVSRHAARVASS